MTAIELLTGPSACHSNPAAPNDRRSTRKKGCPIVPKELFRLNPSLDRETLADRYRCNGRVQVRNALTEGTAAEIRKILASHTPWGMAGQAGSQAAPQAVEAPELRTADGQNKARHIMEASHKTAASGDYACRFARYPMLNAYKERWSPDSPHDMLLEYLNTPDFLELVRDITGIENLVKADAQATLFGPGHFLGRHIDSHVGEGWRVAYVLNLAGDDWHPDWGGYLTFFDEDGDIVEGWKPRFNTLNLFAVPQSHSVSYVTPFAPAQRFAITGWVRDR